MLPLYRVPVAPGILSAPPTPAQTMLLDTRAPARSAGSFGLYDEGGGTFSLYLDATDPRALLQDLLECAREGQVAYLMDGPVPLGGRPLCSGGWLGEARSATRDGTGRQAGSRMPGGVLCSLQISVCSEISKASSTSMPR